MSDSPPSTMLIQFALKCSFYLITRELIIMDSKKIKYKGYNVTYTYLNKITYEEFLEKCFNEYYLKTLADEINEEIEKLKSTK
jgi:hypothetical protein